MIVSSLHQAGFPRKVGIWKEVDMLWDDGREGTILDERETVESDYGGDKLVLPLVRRKVIAEDTRITERLAC